LEEGVLSNFDFYNELNIFTMVTSLLFKNEQFTSFILQKITLSFTAKLTQYMQ